jgi:hypothetical protein
MGRDVFRLMKKVAITGTGGAPGAREYALALSPVA